ncbi:TetR/AcrR family transcriptional regulator [Brachybacterium sp. AOP3-A1-3]|uniref:TetR/AcrR family transcriptional regulator n=1 Tax=Brachybacterium sp. AOP3-A1-3 TaxID=3457699 RepID=UPI004033B03F
MTASRRRGAVLESAILEAGWQVLQEAGYPGFTFEATAERAGTGKAVLYRRWPDKEALLLAVLSHSYLGSPRELPDAGSLREDVLAQLRSMNERLGPSAAAVLSMIVGSHFEETSIAPAQLRADLLGERAPAMPRILERAVTRGELRGELPERIATLPLDLFRHEMVMSLGSVADETLVDIVDTVFLPLALASQQDGRVEPPNPLETPILTGAGAHADADEDQTPAPPPAHR